MKKRVAIISVVLIIFLCLFVSCNFDIKNEPIEYSLDIAMNVKDYKSDIRQSTKFKTREKMSEMTMVINSNVFSYSMPVEDNMKKSAYPKGESFGEVLISQILINGEEAQFELKENLLKIIFPNSIKKNKNCIVDFVYSLKLPITALRYGYNAYSINMANFYPQIMRADEYNALGDPFYSTADNYNVKITAPNNYILLASGDLKERIDEEKLSKYEFVGKQIRDFAFVLSNVYKQKSIDVDGIKINYMYQVDKNPDKTLEIAGKAVATFNENFGRYNGNTLNICETDFAHGGMEFGNLIYVARKTTWEDRNIVVVHEIAHQWWYHGVGSDQVNHAWQDEGLTEFSVLLFYLKNGDDEIAEKLRWQAKLNVNEFESFLKKNGIAVDARIDRPLNEFLTGYDYTYATYVKGMMMFDFIYEIMGDKAFLEALQGYYKKFCGKQAQPQDLFDSFKGDIGIDKLFYAWLNGKVIM